jgi:hypothetical protein
MDAAEWRLRAERRLEIMLTVQRNTVGMNKGARGIGTGTAPKENGIPTLVEADIDKKISARCALTMKLPESQSHLARVGRGGTDKPHDCRPIPVSPDPR